MVELRGRADARSSRRGARPIHAKRDKPINCQNARKIKLVLQLHSAQLTALHWPFLIFLTLFVLGLLGHGAGVRIGKCKSQNSYSTFFAPVLNTRELMSQIQLDTIV